MPWWSKAKRDTVSTRTAAVQPFSPQSARHSRRTKQAWQLRAQFFASNLGVTRFANGILSDTAARCDQVPERRTGPDEWTPDDSDPMPAEVMRRYGNQDQDASDLIRQHVWHHKVTGEAYSYFRDQPDYPGAWFIRGIGAVDAYSAHIMVRDLPGGSEHDGSAFRLELDQFQRFWVPDDDWYLLAQSPMKAVLADCERYWSLGRRIRREAESVLAMSGLLFTDEEAHIYPPTDGNAAQVSRLDRDLSELAEVSFSDDDSIAAVAPFSLHYKPSQWSQGPKWVEVGRPLDPRVLDARREALESIARGSDLPQSLVVDGPGGGSHWSAWLVDEKFVTNSIAPAMDRVCHGDLTRGVLRPTLRALARSGRWGGNPDDWRWGYDATPVIVHPDAAERSFKLWLGGGLALERMLVENGFDAADAPTPEELAEFVKTQSALRTRSDGSMAGPSAIGPANTVESAPPVPAFAGSLSPWPSEVGSWLPD